MLSMAIGYGAVTNQDQMSHSMVTLTCQLTPFTHIGTGTIAITRPARNKTGAYVLLWGYSVYRITLAT